MTGTTPRSIRAMVTGAASAFVLLAALSGPAAAQGAPAQTSPPAAAMPVPEGLADEVEIRIADLHIALRITVGQEAVFRAYADTMRGNAQAIHALFLTRAQARDFSAPAGLRWYAQLTAAHADAVNKLIAPFDALYQSLSPAQQQAADRYFAELRLRRMARRPGQ